jgi:hypothetical protein
LTFAASSSGVGTAGLSPPPSLFSQESTDPTDNKSFAEEAEVVEVIAVSIGSFTSSTAAAGGALGDGGRGKSTSVIPAAILNKYNTTLFNT